MKKVLVITYYWPPAGGPGVQRILNFVKYLPEFGWQPVVLTVKNGEFPEVDYSFLEEVPEKLSVYRADTIEPYSLYRMLTGRSKNDKIPTYVLTERKNRNFVSLLTTFFRGNLFIPDAKIGWIPAAVRKGLEIIRQDNVQLIYSTSPPQTVNLIARKISKKSGIKWVADLRDPWTDIFYYHQLKRMKWAKRYDRYLEKSTLNSARSIITVSSSLAQLFKTKIPNQYHVIPNGFESRKFLSVKKKNYSSSFKVIHTGHLAGNQNPEILWKSLNILLHKERNFKASIALEFYGRVHDDIIKSIKFHELDDCTQFIDYQSHDKILKVLTEASLLFFVIPICSYSEGILTSKLFEYLGARKPVIGIGPSQGDAAKILAEVQAGKVCDYQDLDAVIAFLQNYFRQWKKEGVTKLSQSKKYLKYTRRNLTQILSSIFNQIIEG